MNKFILSFLFLAIPLWTYGQIPVSGTVTDDTGEPLLGAEVTVKEDPDIKTTTDLDGLFSIDLPSLDFTLIFSYVGFIDEEFSLQSSVPSAIIGIADLDIVLTDLGCNLKVNSLTIGPLSDFSNNSLGLSSEFVLHHISGFRTMLYSTLNTTFNNDARLVDFKIERYQIIRDYINYFYAGLAFKHRSFMIPDKQFDKRQNIIGGTLDYRRHRLFIGYVNEEFQKNEDGFKRGIQHGINLEYSRSFYSDDYNTIHTINLDFSKLNKEEYYSIELARRMYPVDLGIRWRDVSLYKSFEVTLRYDFAF